MRRHAPCAVAGWPGWAPAKFDPHPEKTWRCRNGDLGSELELTQAAKTQQKPTLSPKMVDNLSS